jgi:hypothetical protein
MNLLGLVLGLFFLMVWFEYDGSLVDDVVDYLKRVLTEKQ